MPATGWSILREGAEISSERWFIPTRSFSGYTAARKSPARDILSKESTQTSENLVCTIKHRTFEGKGTAALQTLPPPLGSQSNDGWPQRLVEVSPQVHAEVSGSEPLQRPFPRRLHCLGGAHGPSDRSVPVLPG